jgi:hypothetical protein
MFSAGRINAFDPNKKVLVVSPPGYSSPGSDLYAEQANMNNGRDTPTPNKNDDSRTSHHSL